MKIHLPKKLKNIVVCLVVLVGVVGLLANTKNAVAVNKPDLIISSIAPQTNDSYWPIVTIKNQGSAPASGKVKVLLISLTRNQSALGPPFTEIWPKINLAPGEAYSFVPKKWANYRKARYLKVIVDPPSSSKINELNENNNSLISDRPLPDLKITNVSFDSERRPTFIIVNQGAIPYHTKNPYAPDIDYADNSSVGIFAKYKKQTGSAAVSDVLSGIKWRAEDLPPGQSFTKTWDVVPSPTTKYFNVVVTTNPYPSESPPGIYELNTNNNGWLDTIPLPDFSLGTPTFDANKKPAMTVTNQGDFRSNPISAGVTFTWLIKNKNKLPNPVSAALPQLLPGQTSTQTTINVPPSSARWVSIKVDQNNNVLEKQENNNGLANVRLPFPELAVYGNFNSSSGQVDGRVTNEGDLSVDSFVIKYEWLNASGNIPGSEQTFTLTDTNDTDMTDDNNDGHVGAGESVGFQMAPHPKATAVRITIDPNNQIAEWDEGSTNNVKVVPLVDLSAAEQPIIKKTKKVIKPRF